MSRSPDTKLYFMPSQWADAEVGDIVIGFAADLIRHGGRFYRPGDTSHIDMPTATFRENAPNRWERIE